MRASDYFFKDLRYKVKKTYVPGRDYEKKTVLANVIETVPLEANCYSGVGGGGAQPGLRSSFIGGGGGAPKRKGLGKTIEEVKGWEMKNKTTPGLGNKKLLSNA
jgi:hypothetical protein